MGNGCCCRKKKVVVVPVETTQPVTFKSEPKENPYGYARLYAGVKTSENVYSTPILSLHTYTKAKDFIPRTNTTLVATTQRDTSHSGPSSPTNIKKETTAEKVQCIPIEDIISVSYSTDVIEQRETFETTRERARAPQDKLGCCARIKKCLRETYCCCPKCPCAICKPPPVVKPEYDTDRREHVTGNRKILVEIKCIPYSNIHIPSYVQVLPVDEKIKFYKENFDVDTIKFYLVNNADTDENNFYAKRNEAEAFSRVIVQLRNMVNHYPSPMELDDILKQQEAAVFGDEIRY